MRWWPEAYRDLREVSPGNADGRGWIVDVVSRGALPYDLKWRLEIIEAVRPTLIRLRASGRRHDRLRRMADRPVRRICRSRHTWQIGVGKAWMQRFEFLLKPFFKLNPIGSCGGRSRPPPRSRTPHQRRRPAGPRIAVGQRKLSFWTRRPVPTASCPTAGSPAGLRRGRAGRARQARPGGRGYCGRGSPPTGR